MVADLAEKAAGCAEVAKADAVSRQGRGGYACLRGRCFGRDLWCAIRRIPAAPANKKGPLLTAGLRRATGIWPVDGTIRVSNCRRRNYVRTRTHLISRFG